jgi:hypothetical protein
VVEIPTTQLPVVKPDYVLSPEQTPKITAIKTPHNLEIKVICESQAEIFTKSPVAKKPPFSISPKKPAGFAQETNKAYYFIMD